MIIKKKLDRLYDEYFTRIEKLKEYETGLNFDKVVEVGKELDVINSLILDLRKGKDVDLSYFIKDDIIDKENRI